LEDCLEVQAEGHHQAEEVQAQGEKDERT